MKNIFSFAGTVPGVLLAAALLLVAGCMVGPNYKPPQTATPASWVSVTNSQTNVVHLTTNATDLAQWWTQFQDPELTELVEQAFRTNLDVRLAISQLMQARAQKGVDVSGLWPSVDATGKESYGRLGIGDNSQRSYSAGLNGSWTIDIFGGQRRLLESDEAKILAAHENIHDAQVTLASEIAMDYIELRGAQEQIAIAEQNLKSEQHTADLTRQKLRAGFENTLDAAQADAEAATTAATIPGYETTVQQNIFALSVLLARPPGDLLAELSKPSPVPLTPPTVPVGLPSELLRRRPDIREAEANLHAAAAMIGFAEADFYPQFLLNGSASYQNNVLRDLFAGPSRTWSIGPSFTWPIFEAGKTVSNVRLQKALTDAAYIQYQKTVLSALQSVESALVAYALEWDHRETLNTAVQFNSKARDISQQLYEQGTTDFLSVLDAERSLFGSQTALVQSKQTISADLVALYEALGGGWDYNSKN
jgi:NodT family efflux transporter outer membrane factor (OMF) lipoprotein